jgi:hypothetical protein
LCFSLPVVNIGLTSRTYAYRVFDNFVEHPLLVGKAESEVLQMAKRLFLSWLLGFILAVPTDYALRYVAARFGYQFPNYYSVLLIVLWTLVLFYTYFKPKNTDQQ